MSNLQVTDDGRKYISKMNDAMSKVVTAWWDSLTKTEILAYLAEQPTITADNLRDMLKNESCLLSFEVNFSIGERDVAADFHTDGDV